MKVTAIFGALSLALGGCAHVPGAKIAADSASIVDVEEVSVTGPLIVAFLPPFSRNEANSSGAVEAEAHVNFALSETQQCLGERSVGVRLAHTRGLLVVQGGARTWLRIPDDWPHAVGAYLFDVGRSPCVVYAIAGPSSLQVTLPAAAGEYFSAPACTHEGAGRLCNEHDG